MALCARGRVDEQLHGRELRCHSGRDGDGEPPLEVGLVCQVGRELFASECLDQSVSKLADHLFVLEGDGVIKDFPGGYTEYSIWRDSKLSQGMAESDNAVVPDKSKALPDANRPDKQEIRKALRRTEKAIEKLEQTKKQLEEKFLIPEPKLEDLQRWDRELKETVSQLHDMEITWMELAEQMEK